MTKTNNISLSSDKNLRGHASLIYTALKTQGSMNNRQLSEFLGLPINVITGPVLKLRGIGMVASAGKGRDPETGITVHLWMAVSIGAQQADSGKSTSLTDNEQSKGGGSL